jgi:transmembrane amino acid transporter
VAAIFIYNLIVGVGCLTFPHAFQAAGIVLSAVFLLFMAFLSFMTATWVVETMAAANALLEKDRLVTSTDREKQSPVDKPVCSTTGIPSECRTRTLTSRSRGALTNTS